MKTLKRIVFTLAIVIATTFISSAQPQRDEHPRELPNAAQIEKMVEHMAIDLSLSEEQKTKISALYKAHFNEKK
jgi:Spy/CpxP family protein refolding chaperone